jgi:hypothetical protein
MLSNKDLGINQKHARYRIQRLIKLGEWVESREQVLRLAANSMHRLYWDYLDDKDSYSEYMQQMDAPIDILNEMQIELQRLQMDMIDIDEFKGKVVMTHRFACKEHRESVFVEDFPHEQQQTIKLPAVINEP